MRQCLPLDALLSRTAQVVLAATLLNPEKSWYLSDLAKFVRRRPSSLQGALAALSAAGILRRSKEGNRVYYQADTQCPFFTELQGILAKTVGLADVLKKGLLPFREQILVAFLYGSTARSAERSSSDVDLMVIGSLGMAELASPLREAEERLGRSVNATVYSSSELRKKASSGHHFLKAVLEKEKVFLIGNEKQLAKVAGRKPN